MRDVHEKTAYYHWRAYGLRQNSHVHSAGKKIGGEIISADSMQVYRYMDIGTAKVTKEEADGVPHYLIDEFDPDEEYNVMIFQQKAKAYMEEIWAKGKVPIVVGGTGFYINALLYDNAFTETDGDDRFPPGMLQTGGNRRSGSAFSETLGN